ncbi:MAG: 50S ribosomal protein L11 methyltransferase [Tannerellaceae bacterium]|jgi:ribosomal protein L11 methyltransferase|nr:50S ribosomal protein L11 methyltransferase [Tannerellaceae bacterium]
MDYYELIFTYDSSIETEVVNDVLASELGEIGFESFAQTEEGLSAYIRVAAYNPRSLDAVIASFPLENVTIRYTTNYIKGKDWNEEWEKNYFQPIAIGRECIIHASFHQVAPLYTYNIIIDPKMAFGTGNHETTYLMINEMLPLALEGKEALDMGCGTAVLAILAAKKKAKRVVAVDIDEWACRNALDNIRINQTTDIEVIEGGAGQIPASGKFDVVLANINRNILLNDIKAYASCMKKEACLLMSGFYKEDIPLIEDECKRNGLSVVSYSEKNNWVAVKTQLNYNS